MRLRFLEAKAFSVDGVSVVRAAVGDVVEVPPRLAARYLEAGVAVDPDVKAVPAAPENKAAAPVEPVAARVGRGRRPAARKAGG